MKSPRVVERIIDTLSEQHPNADTELHYRNAFELLAATILSAQSTDERVNMVTPALFDRYPDAQAMARAEPADLEKMILSTGFFRQKSKSLIGMAQKLVDEHAGAVPADMDKLTTLPGVGRKTANVVLGHALGVPGLPVDRHVLRVSNRIGIAEGDEPVQVEAQLCAALPKAKWTLASDVQILHGRRICRPKPLCDQCSVRSDCDYYRLVVAPAVRRGESGHRQGSGPPRRRNAAAVASPPEADPATGSGSSRARSRDDKVRATPHQDRATPATTRATPKQPNATGTKKKTNDTRRVRTARR